MSQYGVREAWESFKTASLAYDGADPTSSLIHGAIVKWASEEFGGRLSPSREMREAFAASVAGAALVDEAVMKLAEDGSISLGDRDFLLALNAEAALRDLSALTKTSGAIMDGIHRALTSNPGKGAIVGAAAGAGLGAWKDDDNRLRGAAFGAVPGAVLGGMAGHAWDGHLTQQANSQKRKQDEASAAQAVADAAQAAHAATAAKTEAAKAAAEEAAERWVENLRRGANMHIDELGHLHNKMQTPETEERLNHAIGLHSYIAANKDALKAHATAFPNKIYEEFIHNMDYPQREHFDKTLRHANTLHKQR